MRRGVLALASLALVGSLQPAQAWHVPPPLVLSVPFRGGVALSLEVEVPEDSRVVAHLEVFDDVEQFAFGRHGHIGSIWSWGWGGTANRYHITTPLTGPVAEYRSPAVAIPSTKERFELGELQGQELLYAAMSDPNAAGEWRIYADEDATVTVVARGPAGVVGDAGFRPGTRVEADTGLATSAAARVLLDGSYALDISDAFFGWFDTGDGRAGYTAHGETEVTSYEHFRGAAAGTYEFWIDLSAGRYPVWLVWADIPVPHGWGDLE